jgi:hypothetical protein
MFMWYPCQFYVISREPWNPPYVPYSKNPLGPFVLWSPKWCHFITPRFIIGAMISFLCNRSSPTRKIRYSLTWINVQQDCKSDDRGCSPQSLQTRVSGDPHADIWRHHVSQTRRQLAQVLNTSLNIGFTRNTSHVIFSPNDNVFDMSTSRYKHPSS